MPDEHAGHRQRMYKKLCEEDLPIQELLEILMFPVLPRRNTNDIAHRLLCRFGSLNAVFSASIEELQSVDGVGRSVANQLYCIGKILRKCMYEPANTVDKIFESKAFIERVGDMYKGFSYEVMDVYFLDRMGKILNRCRFSEYKKSHIRFNTKDLAKLLVEQSNVSGMVIVHNHPEGKPSPSQKDDEATKCAQLVCNVHDVLLCDHVIFSTEGVYSYYLSGRMAEISRQYSFSQIAVKEEQR